MPDRCGSTNMPEPIPLTRLSSFSVKSNIGIRSIEFHAVDAEIETHEHNFAHTMMCVLGEVEVWSKAPHATEAQRAILKPGEWFVVEAGEKHGGRAVTAPAQVCCIFAHRTPQGEVVQEFAGYYEGAN